MALKLHGASEIILALWLLSGKYLRVASALTAALLLVLTVVNGFDETFLSTFRNVGLMMMAIFLAIDKPVNTQ